MKPLHRKWDLFPPKRKIQALADRAWAIKGVHIRTREDGVGGEFSQMLSNLSLGANLMNQLARGTWGNTRQTARTLTLGRQLIVGQKTLTLQKTVMSQQAAFQATKNMTQNARPKLTNTISMTPIPDKHFKNWNCGYMQTMRSHAQSYPRKFPKKYGHQNQTGKEYLAGQNKGHMVNPNR